MMKILKMIKTDYRDRIIQTSNDIYRSKRK